MDLDDAPLAIRAPQRHRFHRVRMKQAIAILAVNLGS